VSKIESFLTVGLMSDDDRRSAVLEEMISQLGLDYEWISNGDIKYPAVIIDTVARFESARRHVDSDDAIVVAEKVCDIKSIYSLLSGMRQHTHDAITPVVNIEERKLMDIIRAVFTRQGLPLVYKPLWPGGHDICVVLTHDVDWLAYNGMHRVVFHGSLDFRRALPLAFKSLLRGTNLGWNIPELTELENKYNTKSTFFFKTRYDTNSELLAKSIGIVKESGSEVALHASYDSHVSGGSLSRQIEFLESISGKEIKGVRHHILKTKPPDTWKIEAAEGLSYDATFAYNRFFGFRAGSCLPYHPFGEIRLPIIELPTSFMDWTALHRNIRGEKFFRSIEQVLDVVNEYGGVFVVNFHNTYMNGETFPDVVSAYERFLQKVTTQNSWVATASQCVEWWSTRESTPLRAKLNRDGTIEVGTALLTPLVESTHRFQVNVVRNGQD